MARKVMPNLPFKLAGSRNTRDLGGYPTKYGICTANGQFIRSDNPGKFNDADKKRLVEEYGVRTYVDLRSESECEKDPCALIGYPGVKYKQFTMLDNVHSDPSKTKLPDSLYEIYVDLLDNSRAKFLNVFKFMLENLDDCIFFNCTAGKDRTGTTAMILLKLAGVSNEDILIDYSPTGANIWPDMKPLFEAYQAKGINIDRDMAMSRPIHMARTLAHLEYKYKTIENWLALVGLTEDEIDALRNKLLGIRKYRAVMPNLPFKLEGSKNTRDLGGYPTKYGMRTANGQFLRSDNPSKFTEADTMRLINDYGVKLVCDLRSPSEISKEPCSLIGYNGLDYRPFTMLDNVHSDPSKTKLPATLGELYIDLLDNSQARFYGVFKAMLEHLDDCIFFNCTAGKDRTGTTAMILLKLAGVSDENVIIDYKSTGDNIKEDMDRLYAAMGPNPPFDIDYLRSRPVHMEKALAHVKEKYGDIENWLSIVGLSTCEITALRNKMLGLK